jgi:hypothetical protein
MELLRGIERDTCIAHFYAVIENVGVASELLKGLSIGAALS